MHRSVKAELSKYRLLKERLVLNFPFVDDETLQDTLEGITDLHEMIAAVIRSALVDEALYSGLRFRVYDSHGLSSEPARSGNWPSKR